MKLVFLADGIPLEKIIQLLATNLANAKTLRDRVLTVNYKL